MTKKRRRRSWSPAEKQKLVAEARARRQRGESWARIAEALDVRPDALRRWTQQWPEALGLRAVQVAGFESESSRGARTTTGLSVVSPDGFRFEGVDLETAVWLYRSLR